MPVLHSMEHAASATAEPHRYIERASTCRPSMAALAHAHCLATVVRRSGPRHQKVDAELLANLERHDKHNQHCNDQPSPAARPGQFHRQPPPGQ